MKEIKAEELKNLQSDLNTKMACSFSYLVYKSNGYYLEEEQLMLKVYSKEENKILYVIVTGIEENGKIFGIEKSTNCNYGFSFVDIVFTNDKIKLIETLENNHNER